MGKDVIIACDFESAEKTFAFLDKFTDKKPFVKIGMELFYAEGPSIVKELKKRGHKIFLDLKLHDIPNTVKKAMASLSKLDIDMCNVHAAGTREMMKAAIEGLTREDGTTETVPAHKYTISFTNFEETYAKFLEERAKYIADSSTGRLYREFSGTVKSSIGLGVLLRQGIGDTVRVSLSDDPVEEIKVAKEILKDCGLYTKTPTLVACPTCGRTMIDLIPIAKQVEDFLQTIEADITVAVMGCAVNGPGEARNADIGIAGGSGVAVLFKKGKIVRKLNSNEIVEVLKEEILHLVNDVRE